MPGPIELQFSYSNVRVIRALASGQPMPCKSIVFAPKANSVDVDLNPFNFLFTELSLGELLHDDMFGLFEAMSAIELMDPKMDAGMQCNRLKGRSEDQTGKILRVGRQ